MRYKLLYLGLVFLGCYGINKKGSDLGFLYTKCFTSEDWVKFKNSYSTDSIKDSIFLKHLNEIKNEPFESEVLYFNEDPKELIGITQAVVRYVYNPKISSMVLDGMSSELSEKERKRVVRRIQNQIIQYQCNEGKTESLNYIRRELTD